MSLNMEKKRMDVSRKTRFNLLIDRNVKNSQEAADSYPASATKLAKNAYVNMDVLVFGAER